MSLDTLLPRLAALTLTLLWATSATAQPFPADQDTVDVAPGGVNVLFDAIANDTDTGEPGGTRLNLNRVYRLQRDARYLLISMIEGDFPLNIIAAEPTSGDPDSTPPIIQRANDDTGNSPGPFIDTSGDQTFRGLYFIGETPTGSNKFTNINSTGEDVVLTYEDCVFEYITGIAIDIDGFGSSIYLRNNVFRNFANPNQIFSGRALRINARGGVAGGKPSVRDVVFENNTFSNIGGFVFVGPRSGENVAVERFRFNHNTVYTTGNYVLLEEAWTDAIVSNNLFINPVAFGETVDNRDGQDPDGLLYGVFNADTLRTGNTTPEDQRRIGIVSNANYRDPALDAYYASTPAGNATRVEGEPFFNSRTQALFDARDGFVVRDLLEGEAPGFTTPPDALSLLIQFARDYRTDPRPNPLTFFFYDPDGSANAVTWPLPEDLTYSNPAYLSAGINGYPLGDLNWYPDQKEAWEAAGGAQADYDAVNALLPVSSETGPDGASMVTSVAPNPTSGLVGIRVTLAAPASVSVEIFDMLGRRVMASGPRQLAAGEGQPIMLDTAGLPGGAYAYRVVAGQGADVQVSTGRLTVVR